MALGSFSALLSSSMRLVYGPALLFIILRVLELTMSSSTMETLVAPAVSCLKLVAKQSEAELVGDWEKVIYSAISSILDIAS